LEEWEWEEWLHSCPLHWKQWSLVNQAVFHNCYKKVISFFDNNEADFGPHFAGFSRKESFQLAADASLKIAAHEGHLKIVEALLERK